MSATNEGGASVNLKLEIHIVPVTDVDRANGFTSNSVGGSMIDVSPMEGLRIVKLPPPGSATSITFGLGLTKGAPGSTQGALIVSDIEAAHDGLAAVASR